MKQMLSKIFRAFILVTMFIPAFAATIYASNIQIMIDGVVISSDVNPEIKNGRTMVPLRVIGENLGVQVDWLGSDVLLTKHELKVIIRTNHDTALVNSKVTQLDVKPYVKNDRMMVPLRFIAETFDSDVNYENSTVTIDTKPLVIDGTEVKSVQRLYHMTMGNIVEQIDGNEHHKAIYDLIMKNKGKETEAPEHYSWMVNMDVPGSYYHEGQYDFLDVKGESFERFEIYTLNKAFPDELLEGYPEVLLHDAIDDKSKHRQSGHSYWSTTAGIFLFSTLRPGS